jgi:hypothetical protein
MVTVSGASVTGNIHIEYLFGFCGSKKIIQPMSSIIRLRTVGFASPPPASARLNKNKTKNFYELELAQHLPTRHAHFMRM